MTAAWREDARGMAESFRREKRDHRAETGTRRAAAVPGLSGRRWRRAEDFTPCSARHYRRADTEREALRPSGTSSRSTVTDRSARGGRTSAAYPIEGDGPLVVIVGNCQAESLRIMMGAADVRTVRLPAVHEIVESDLNQILPVIERADVLITQPIRNDYHGLPIGTTQLRASLRPAAALVVVPVIRFAGLYPTHALIRPPSDPSLEPPIVPYHDLRTLAEAAGVDRVQLTPTTVSAIGRLSIHELERRELHHDTVRISDVFAEPNFDAMRTINHPGNSVFAELARRVRDRAELPPHDVDPGRPILANIHAPRSLVVIDAFQLDTVPTHTWSLMADSPQYIEEDRVRAAHLDWYRAHPAVLDAGLTRHADALRILQAA